MPFATILPYKLVADTDTTKNHYLSAIPPDTIVVAVVANDS